MRKKVLLSIDGASWTSTSPTYRHPYPATFPSRNSTSVHVLSSLLQLGVLTVPIRGARFSLAAYWAHVRYCAAIDQEKRSLRLVRDWADLDSHQKTILSDDWGVGFTTHWLAQRLRFEAFCDGRYFIERLGGLGIATVIRQPKKRGPYKCPDFIFEDDQGLLHIVECKGNQQGHAFLRSQLDGGLVQKQSIVFANEQAQVGQRIVAGLFVADSNSEEESLIAIRDPEPRGPQIKLRQDADPEQVRDVIHREDLARQFVLLGGYDISTELLEMPESDSLRLAHRRRSFAEGVDRLARSLERRPDNSLLTRSVTFPFPFGVSSDEKQFRSVTVSHAVREDYLARFKTYDPSKKTLTEQFPESDSLRLGWMSSEHTCSATLHRGQGFVSTISLND